MRLGRSGDGMAKADSFKFNFGRAGDEPKNVAVDVSTDSSAAEQQCFVDRRQEAMADSGQRVWHSSDREWPDLPSSFAFPVGPFMGSFEEAHEAGSGAGFAGRVVVDCDQGRRRPDFDSGFYDLAIEGASGREFRRVELGDPAGRIDATTTAGLFEGQSPRLGGFGFAPAAGEPR